MFNFEIQQGAQLGDAAVVSDRMAMETESDICSWWLIEVMRTAETPPAEYECPELGDDVKLEYPRTKKALLVQRFIPVPTSKGVSTTRFVLDTKLGPFYVPCHLLRVGKIQLKRHEPQEVARRSQRIASSAPAPVPIFEISAEKKHEIIVQCRALT